MAKVLNIEVDEKVNEKRDSFLKNVESNMYYKSELSSDLMVSDWLEDIENACPYLDNIIRHPKVALITEEDVVKIEKAKKISVASVKDLSRHTHFIEKVDRKTNEVRPSKILIVRNEETFNTYENRFIYTLLDRLARFISTKEKSLEDSETKDEKFLEYSSSTSTDTENVSIELRIVSKTKSVEDSNKDFKKELDDIKARIKRIKDYIANWKRSEMIESLEKAHVSFVTPPIKKTNVILKNPNFQIAMKLWAFLQMYDYNYKSDSKDGMDTTGDGVLKSILEDSFLMDFFVLDSISPSKREQKEKLSKYMILMISQQIERAVSLLLSNGIKISDEEILKMISNEIKKQKNRRTLDSTDIKKKFKTALDEYLERTQDYI